MFQLTQSLIRKLTQTIDTIPSAGLDVNVRRLCKWIFAQAKIAIVYSRFNKYRSSGTQCVVTLFKAKVISRVNVEYQFARFQNTVCNFVERWNTYNVLGKVGNDNIVLTYRGKCFYLIFKDYYVYTYMYNILKYFSN